MISKYHHFLRNFDSLGDRAKNYRHTIEPKTIFWEKNKFFTMISKYHNFPRNINSLRVRPNERFFGFVKVIWKYYNFLQNIDSLRHTIEPKTIFWEKNQFFTMISKYYNFLRNIDSLGDGAKNVFLEKNCIILRWSHSIVISPEVLIV